MKLIHFVQAQIFRKLAIRCKLNVTLAGFEILLNFKISVFSFELSILSQTIFVLLLDHKLLLNVARIKSQNHIGFASSIRLKGLLPEFILHRLQFFLDTICQNGDLLRVAGLFEMLSFLNSIFLLVTVFERIPISSILYHRFLVLHLHKDKKEIYLR